MNLGPVLPDSEGKLIEALKLPGPYARCNTSRVLPDDYTEQIAQQFPHDLPFGGHVGGELGKRDQSLSQQEEKYRPSRYAQDDEGAREGEIYNEKIIQDDGDHYVYLKGDKYRIENKENITAEKHMVKITGESSAVLLNDTYTVEIDRISNSGNGIVYVEGYELSIGKTDPKKVGSKIKVKIKNKKEAEVKSKKEEVRETHIVEVDRISNSGNGVIYIDGNQMVIRSIEKSLVGSKVKVAVEDFQSAVVIDTTVSGGADNTEECENRSHEKYTEKSSAQSTEQAQELTESVENGESVNSRSNNNQPESDQRLGPVSGGATETVSHDTDKSVSELRERAKEAARENPIREQGTSTSSRYYRSNDIREFARTRADGICECCQEPAPFDDKDGQPYLEVHHTEELSEGGSDSIDNVAAICPTCHTRIHYGEDGNRLNNKLEQDLNRR